MSLSGVYIDLWRSAQETGADQARELRGGARLGVRVLGDITTLTISRKSKRIGDVELRTFVRDCGVPATAIRFPLDGQTVRERDGAQWHSVTFRWRDEVSE